MIQKNDTAYLVVRVVLLVCCLHKSMNCYSEGMILRVNPTFSVSKSIMNLPQIEFFVMNLAYCANMFDPDWFD